MAYSGNGAGTRTDPYQVTTIEQLTECFDIYNNTDAYNKELYVYCKLMNDLDFNDNPQYWDCPAELFKANNGAYSTGQIHGVIIDGNNFGIYNMYVFNKPGIFVTTAYSSIGNFIRINNCVLEAVVVNSTEESTNLVYSNDSYLNSGIFFNNCDLRIKTYFYNGETDRSNLFRFASFNSCILNIDIVINKQGFSSKSARPIILFGKEETGSSNVYRNFYNEWNIRIILISNSNLVSNAMALLFIRTCHFFSSFFIEMVATKANFVNKIKFSNNGYPTNINNCYFVVKNTNATYKASLQFIGTIKNGVNFYDSQLADGQITDNSEGSGELLALTTAQCKDAEYLEQQGFIIAR